MRIDLTDTTFIIPVRIDSMIRLENLLMSVDSIVRYFRTRILILEASSYQNEIIPSLIKDDTVKYTFLVDIDPVFYKTKYLTESQWTHPKGFRSLTQQARLRILQMHLF